MKRYIAIVFAALVAFSCSRASAPKGVVATSHKLGSANAAILSFTSGGTYTASKSFAIICGCGAGGGGGSGGTPLEVGTQPSSPGIGGSAGGTGIYSCVNVSPTPGTAYTVTVGAGGTGGATVAAGNGVGGNDGTDGSDTTVGALATFRGAGKGYGATSMNMTSNFAFLPGGLVAAANVIKPTAAANATVFGFVQQPFQGGASYGFTSATTTSWGGLASPQGFGGGSAGINGTTASTSFGGTGGGGASGSGFVTAASATGGAGGNGNSAGVGVAGGAGKRQDGTTSTAAQTTGSCVGGGGGGTGGQGSGANVSGAGGAGGGGDSGRAVVIEFQ